MTCRCKMCGRNNAGGNNARRDGLRVGVGTDEHCRWWGGLTKREARRLQRRRASKDWRRDLEVNAA